MPRTTVYSGGAWLAINHRNPRPPHTLLLLLHRFGAMTIDSSDSACETVQYIIVCVLYIHPPPPAQIGCVAGSNRDGFPRGNACDGMYSGSSLLSLIPAIIIYLPARFVPSKGFSALDDNNSIMTTTVRVTTCEFRRRVYRRNSPRGWL